MLNSKGEELRQQLIDWIQSDDSAFEFILWCFGVGLRKVTGGPDEEVDEDILATFAKIKDSMGILMSLS